MLANQQIVFIDSQIVDLQVLANEVTTGIEVIILKGDRDGVSQITEILNQRNNLTSIHIVSHGSPGCLYLGNTQLSLDTLDRYQSEFKNWFSLSLLLYGCNVAAGDAGEEFISKLHDITGAEIAASTTPIGNADLGGNWNLEYQTRKVSISSIFSPEVQHDYAGILEEEDPLAPELTEELVEDIATVTTDLDDYAPGSTATITGENFEPGETIELQILHTDGTPNTGGGHEPWQVTDGGAGDLDGEVNGTIITTWFVNPDDSGGSAFKLTAAGLNSGKLANHYFTDSDPAVQFFYIPFEEDDLETAFNVLEDNATVSTDIRSIISLTVSTDNTIIYYDHWEDNGIEGYEADLNNPTQTDTEIWGDNDPSNGIAPGFTTDVLNAGDIVKLDETIDTTSSATFYDGRDKVGASKAIVATRQVWASSPGTVLAGASEIIDASKWGTEFTIPVGSDTASDSMFEYSSLFITATKDNTNITISGVDTDNDGAYDDTLSGITLNEGETYFVDGNPANASLTLLGAGATVNADKNIQAHLVTGDIAANWESRFYTLFPTDQWSNVYYTPVGTDSTETDNPTDIFIYNPNDNDITVYYDRLDDSTGNLTTTSFTVTAKSEVRQRVDSESGAKFYTDPTEYTTGEEYDFFALGAIDANSDTELDNINANHDWGFSLIPDTNLTPQIQIGWGLGSSDSSVNGNPIWVSTTEDTTVYIDYDGDRAGSLTDINGNQYDEAFSISALESVRVKDVLNNDNDQTGIRLYTIDGTDIIAAWGQEPVPGTQNSPYLDLGTAILPLPVAYSWKTSTLVSGTNANGDPGDVNADGNVDPGDTIEYNINIQNDGVVVLGNVNVSDIVPDGTTYVPGSKTINGVAVGDDTSGTTFPLDDDKIDNGIDDGRNIGNIGVGESANVGFQVTINDPYDGSLDGVTNSANVDSDTDSFTVAVNQPIDFTDIVQTKTLYLSDNSGSNDLDRVDPTNSDPINNSDSEVSILFASNTIENAFDSDWTEINDDSDFANGNVLVVGGELQLDDNPNSGGEPGIERAIDLSGANSATLSFDFTTDIGVDATDAVTLDISDDGGSSYTTLETFTNIIGDSSGSRTYNLENNINLTANTEIRFRVTDSYGFTDETFTVSNIDITSFTGNTETFSQSISMQSDFDMPSGQPVEITAYIDVSSGTPTTASDITANLTYNSGTLLNLSNPTSVTLQSGTIYEVTWQANLDRNTTIPAGEAVSLDLTNNDSSLDFQLRYDGSGTFASKIDLPTISVIDITDIGIYDAANGGGSLVNSVAQDETVYVRVEVEDPFGDYDITSLDLDIKDSDGASILAGVATLTSADDIDVANVDNKRIYEYAWTPTTALTTGEYTVEVEAFEGYEGTISDTDSTTITLNDGTVPDVIIGDDIVTEGTSLVFDITLSGTTTPTTDIVLDLTTSDNTATGISDYETTAFEYSIDGGATWLSAGGTNGTEVTIPAGSSGIKVRIDSTDDTTDEPDETFTLGINSVVSGSVGDTSDTGTGTILDDDDAPSISIDDVTLTEGDSAQKEFTFTVTLDNSSSETVTVNYATADGTATTADNDYTALPNAEFPNDTLTFAPGETSKTITVNVTGDITVETDQTFTVDLSGATNATIADSQGVGTILNDDSTPLFEINDVTIVEGNEDLEGNSVPSTLEFTVTRSGDTTSAVTIDYATADNTATTSDSDYDSISGTLSFAAGITTQTISVTINGDTPPEGDDSFYVNLSNASLGTIVDSQGLGIIQNDDASGTISGNVSADTNNDDVGDSILSGVTIELLDSDGNSIDSDSTTSGVQPTITTTDTNGDYSFTGVALGSYQVQETNLSGYTDVSEVDGGTDGGDDTDSGDNGITDNIPVVLAADGEVDSGNDFVDEEVGSISGEVLADTNNDDVGDSPIEGVTVELFLDGGSTAIATTTTNSSGGYSFSNLAPGDYDVKQTNLSNYTDVKDLDTNADGSANGASGNTDQNLVDVSLSPGEDSTGNDFVDERGVISGTVTEDTSDPDDTTGDIPLANVTIELLDNSSNVVATTTTDASGNYSFTDLEPDTYTVRQTDLAGYESVIDNDETDDDGGAGGSDNDVNANTNDNEITVDLAAGESDTGNNFVERAQPGTISGQVLEDTTGNGIGDTPIAGVTITLSGSASDTTTTDINGEYSFTGLSAGTYTVTEANPANYNDVNELDSNDNGTDDTDLEDKDTANDNQLTVVLAVNEADTGNDFVDEAEPGIISGTVQADTTGNGTGDTNLENVTVSLLDELGNPVLNGSGVAITDITDASGFYEFTDVAPGNYQVAETDLTGYSSVKDEDSITDSVDDDAANSNDNDNKISVTLLAGETDSGNNFVDHQNGIISGTVEEDTDNNGSGDSALSGVTITLKDSLGNTVATEVTNSSGDYTFSDVVPGSYTVEETDPSGYSSVSDADNDADAVSDDATNSNPNDNSLAVTLLPNETDSGNDFVDELNGSISGSVTADTDNDDDGDDPISGVTITLRNASDDSTVATTTTDGGGNYSFTDIAPGDYEVVETTPSGYADVNELDSVNDGSNDTDNETAGANNDNILAITLASGESDTGNDFVDEQTGSISGIVSLDTVGGTGIAGVTITLTNTDTSTVVGTTTTATDGTYSFTDLAPGNYQIDETDLGTYDSVSDIDSDDSDDINSNTNDNQLIVALSARESDTANNFVDELDSTAGTISGQVLEDTDGDGVGDTPISGVLITLGGDASTTTTTAIDGTYSFTGLADGNYTLTETDPTSPSTYVSISDTDGDNDNSIAVALSTSSVGNDFIDGLPASISGVIWSDFDANGLEGNFEDGVSGLSVTLTGGGPDGLLSTTGDNTITPVTTTADGSYSFTGLNPGEEYQVEFPTSVTGYSGLTTQDAGSNEAIDSDADTSTGITGTITLNPNEDRIDVDAGLLPDDVIDIGGTSVSETIPGTNSDETIAGYKGQDTLSGGGGEDTFFFNETSDGVDIITDFNDAGSDKVDLRQILATEVAAANSSNVLSDGYVLFTQYSTLGTMVQIDFDGSAGELLPKSVVLLQGDDVIDLDTTNIATNDDFLFF